MPPRIDIAVRHHCVAAVLFVSTALARKGRPYLIGGVLAFLMKNIRPGGYISLTRLACYNSAYLKEREMSSTRNHFQDFSKVSVLSVAFWAGGPKTPEKKKQKFFKIKNLKKKRKK